MSDDFNHEADAWDDLLFGVSSEEVSGQTRGRHCIQCKRCGADHLSWAQLPNGKWWLKSGAEWHTCKEPKA